MATRGFNAWRIIHWGSSCKPQGMKYTWDDPHQAVSWIDRRWETALSYLEYVFTKHGYIVKSAGSYNCRPITNGTIMSPHAWPLAVDINPAKNPYRPMPDSGPITDIPFEVIKDVYRIRTVDGLRVWKWGGDWDGDWNFDDHTVTDAMHFEIIVTPSELSKGPLVYDGTIDPGMEVPMLKQGDKGNAVRYFQACVNGVDEAFNQSKSQIMVDGVYGPATVEAVRGYQRSADLATTGSIDGLTATLLDRFHPKYGSYWTTNGGSGGMTQAQADERYARKHSHPYAGSEAFAEHAGSPTGHKHRHDEGRTGYPVA